MLRTRRIPMTPILVGHEWVAATPTGVRRFPLVRGGDGDAPADGAATVVPENLAEVPDDELDTIEAALLAEFDQLHDEGKRESLPRMRELSAALVKIGTERTARSEQAAADEAEMAKLAEEVHGSDDGTEGDGTDPDEGGDPQPKEGDEPDPNAPATEPEGGKKTDKEPVTAGAGRPTPPAPRRGANAAGTTRRAGTPTVAKGTQRMSIVASADTVAGKAGATLDSTGVAVAMHEMARTLPDHSERKAVAVYQIPNEYVIDDSHSGVAIAAIFDKAAALPSGVVDAKSLVAAGGYCGPTENVYDLVAYDAQTGLLDLPSVGITRGGGINLPGYIELDAADSALWTWSADQDADVSIAFSDLDIASGIGTMTATGHLLIVGDQVEIVSVGATAADGPHNVLTVTNANVVTLDMTGVADATNITGVALRQKKVFRIPCPTWTEYKLGARGFAISHGNLMDRSFPQLSARYVQLVMNAHAHRNSAMNLAVMRSATHSTAVTVTAAGTDSYGEVMSAIALSEQDYRSEHKIGANVVLDLPMPVWSKALLRADIAMREGLEERAVPDSKIVSEITALNVRPQFLEDYQPMWNGTPRATWPTSFEALLYPTGSFVEGNGGTITQGVQRDSVQNKTNDFTLAWTEDFRLVARRGPKARKLTINCGAPDGKTGGTGA